MGADGYMYQGQLLAPLVARVLLERYAERVRGLSQTCGRGPSGQGAITELLKSRYLKKNSLLNCAELLT